MQRENSNLSGNLTGDRNKQQNRNIPTYANIDMTEIKNDPNGSRVENFED